MTTLDTETTLWCAQRKGYADETFGCDTATHDHAVVVYNGETGKVLYDETHPRLGRNIAVARFTTYCDSRDGGPDGHEVTVVTDGFTCYAYGTARGNASDCGLASRDGSTLTIACQQPASCHRDCDDCCPGYVTVDLSQPGSWTADPDAIETLARYGERVESDRITSVTPEQITPGVVVVHEDAVKRVLIVRPLLGVLTESEQGPTTYHAFSDSRSIDGWAAACTAASPAQEQAFLEARERARK